MTVNECFELRQRGHIEEAYEAIRLIYATDKSPFASACMFWTATDVLRRRVNEHRTEEAQKILLALKRLLSKVNDHDGQMESAYRRCEEMLECETGKAPHLLTGTWGEELATAYLREKGYVILDRNWRSVHRDIDIVAQHDGFLVFVEVKTRSNRTFINPEDAVNYKKRKNLQRAINNYVKYHHSTLPIRFDIITVVGLHTSSNPEIDHLKNIDITKV